MHMLHAHFPTPLGDLLLIGENGALAAIHLPGLHRMTGNTTESTEPFADDTDQLREYFEGRRSTFPRTVPDWHRR